MIKIKVYPGCSELFKTPPGIIQHLALASKCFRKLISMKTTRNLKDTNLLNQAMQSNYKTNIPNNDDYNIKIEVEDNITNNDDDSTDMQEEEKNGDANQNKMPFKKDPTAIQQAAQQLEEPMILGDEDVPMIHNEDHIHIHDDIVCVKLLNILDDMGAPLYAYNAIINWESEAHARGY